MEKYFVLRVVVRLTALVVGRTGGGVVDRLDIFIQNTLGEMIAEIIIIQHARRLIHLCPTGVFGVCYCRKLVIIL